MGVVMGVVSKWEKTAMRETWKARTRKIERECWNVRDKRYVEPPGAGVSRNWRSGQNSRTEGIHRVSVSCKNGPAKWSFHRIRSDSCGVGVGTGVARSGGSWVVGRIGELPRVARLRAATEAETARGTGIGGGAADVARVTRP